MGNEQRPRSRSDSEIARGRSSNSATGSPGRGSFLGRSAGEWPWGDSDGFNSVSLFRIGAVAAQRGVEPLNHVLNIHTPWSIRV